MKIKTFIVSFLMVLFVVSFNSCKENSINDPSGDSSSDSGTDSGSNAGTQSSGKKVAELLAANKSDHEKSADYTWNSTDVVDIALNGASISGGGTGVNINGTTVTISAGGTYRLAGTLTNGQIIINSSDENTVRLILNGANLTNTSSAPIYVQAADKAVIILADNTQNYITDGSSYVFADATEDEPNAAIFSKDDLSISGGGSLTVKANYNDAIASKDGLVINGGTLSITSVDDGIRGKDYLVVRNGNISLDVKGDGLKSDNDEDATKGYIYITSGTFNLKSTGDAITAETDVLISDGTFTITTGGGSSYTASSTSSKGIKGIVYSSIDGGNFTFSTADDAVHSNSNVTISGGQYTIASGDDGIHADSTVAVNDGTINITKSYEGIEGAHVIINGGTIHITSSDDGVNGAGGNDGSSTNGRPGQGTFVTSGNYSININGGYLYVNAGGDGIDVNGSLNMSAGTVLVNGPTSNANGALDYDSSFKLTGGFLVAAGSAGMAQGPGSSSTQYSVLIGLRSTFSANTMFHIQASDGTEILTFTPKKNYQSVVFSSSKLVSGKSYDVYTGGSYSGTTTDGLGESGTYSGGTKYGSFTVSGVATTVSL